MNHPLPSSQDPLDALFAQARVHRPDTGRAEYGFETRLMERLPKAPAPASIWFAVSWRMASVLTLVTLGLVCWEVQVDTAAQNAEQAAYLQNPEAADLLSTF